MGSASRSLEQDYIANSQRERKHYINTHLNVKILSLLFRLRKDFKMVQFRQTPYSTCLQSDFAKSTHQQQR